jgi:SIR2-like protein
VTTVYFLGAGASAADDLPLTNELNLAIAHALVNYEDSYSRLAQYYKTLYGIRRTDMKKAAAAWQTFLEDRKRQPETPKLLPNVVETLSLIDLAIAQDASFGERLTGAALLGVRNEMTRAIAFGVKEAGLRRQPKMARKLIDRMKPGDVVISTNWDVLVERAISYYERKASPRRSLRETTIDFGAVDARTVSWRGKDRPLAATGRRKVLKLHGSLNWFYCARCCELYANVDLPWILDPEHPRPLADYCHCGVPLRNIMIAPSYVKEYGNAHLQSVWRHATMQLREADKWVFIGYSLPSDDYHIRGMLLRALSAKIDCAKRNQSPPIDVVAHGPDEALMTRYSDLFRRATITFHTDGMSGYLA